MLMCSNDSTLTHQCSDGRKTMLLMYNEKMLEKIPVEESRF